MLGMSILHPKHVLNNERTQNAMSTMIWGFIESTDMLNLCSHPDFNFKIVETCAFHKFGINFQLPSWLPSDEIDRTVSLPFIISNNFLSFNCDRFMEPIYWPENGTPTFNNLKKDIKKICDMFQIIFSFDSVKEINLYITDGDTDLCEYKSIHMTLADVPSIVFEEYYRAKWIPTIHLIIKK